MQKEIEYLIYDESAEKISVLINEGKLIPFLGSGFTKGLSYKNGTVLDGEETNAKMKEIIYKTCSDISPNDIVDFKLVFFRT